MALNQKKAGLLCTDANDDLSYKVEQGSDICLEQSGRPSDICYYIYRCGIICTKRFMTLATPGIFGQDF